MKTIGMDGLNSSGKGTQIRLLRGYFSKKDISSVILRGAGLRAGRGLRNYDPPSKWWGENAQELLDKSTDYAEKLNDEYQRLSREFAAYKRRGRKKVVLLDRSFVSRYFAMRQFFPNISLQEALTSYNPKNGKEVAGVVPDITFVLEVGKEVLLDRIRRKEGFNLARKEIVERTIKENYNLFCEILEEVRSREEIWVLDGEKDLYDLNKEIVGIIKNE
ncbi:MAG: hypothetical protein ABH817_00195 [archaeon]